MSIKIVEDFMKNNENIQVNTGENLYSITEKNKDKFIQWLSGEKRKIKSTITWNKR